MSDVELPLRGGCACGAVRFEIGAPLVGALYCHCSRCRHRSGSAYSVNALTAPGSFRLVAGEEHVTVFDPGDGGWLKAFCRVCGGHTHTTNPQDAAVISVRLGAVDGEPGVRPAAHQFTAYAPAWSPVPDDGLPRFDERIELPI